MARKPKSARSSAKPARLATVSVRDGRDNTATTAKSRIGVSDNGRNGLALVAEGESADLLAAATATVFVAVGTAYAIKILS